MPDNWGFVAAAYGLTALVLGIYWRRLVRREKALSTAPSVAERSPNPSGPAHPRRKPDTTSSRP